MKSLLSKFFDNLTMYEDTHCGSRNKQDLKEAIDTFIVKQDFSKAKDVYTNFFKTYWVGTQSSDNPFLSIVATMRDYESSLGKFFEKQRDHYVHSVNVFLLGICIYISNIKYRDVFETYLKETQYLDHYDDTNEEFFYRWGVASLFHDVAYPLELLLKSLGSYINRLLEYPSDVVGSAGFTQDLIARSELTKLEKLLPLSKYEHEFYVKYPQLKSPPTHFNNLIGDYISNRLKINSATLFKKISVLEGKLAKNGVFDHAYYGAIISARWYHSLIKTTGWNPAYFYYPVVDSSSAIFLHNAYEHFLIKEFSLPPLAFDSLPIAFMLILCDQLQDWSRQVYGSTASVIKCPDGCEVAADHKETVVRYLYNKNIPSINLFITKKTNKVHELLDFTSVVDIRIVPEVKSVL